MDADDVSITVRNANGVAAIEDKSSDEDVIALALGPRKSRRKKTVGQGEVEQPAPVDDMVVAVVYEGPQSKLVAEMDPGAPEEDVVAEAGSGGSSSEDSGEDGDASEADRQSEEALSGGEDAAHDQPGIVGNVENEGVFSRDYKTVDVVYVAAKGEVWEADEHGVFKNLLGTAKFLSDGVSVSLICHCHKKQARSSGYARCGGLLYLQPDNAENFQNEFDTWWGMAAAFRSLDMDEEFKHHRLAFEAARSSLKAMAHLNICSSLLFNKQRNHLTSSFQLCAM